MKLILANPRGFCAGVNMAIQTVDDVLEVVGPPLYVYHEIVHNRHVVERFVGQGVRFVESIDDVPAGSVVVFSAHGVSPEVRAQADARSLTMIDATCPLVTKVHVEALRYASKGYQILLIGHSGHDEVVGTVGEAPDAIQVVQSPDDIATLTIRDPNRLAYLTQTTLSLSDAERIIRALEEAFPNITAPPKEDICYATTNRQTAVAALASDVDLVLVVGSQSSSNSLRLTEIADAHGTRAYLVDDRRELDHAWFEGVERVLLTAGASAPEDLLQGIVDELYDRYSVEIEDQWGREEDVHFRSPQSLRDFQLAHKVN